MTDMLERIKAVGEVQIVPLPKKVLFLDVDGVLNGSLAATRNAPLVPLIWPRCVEQLNRVLDATNCDVVLSSAWRFIIHHGLMSEEGFCLLMRTHGVRKFKLAGRTEVEANGYGSPNDRKAQIANWLLLHPEVKKFAVVDDMAMGHAPEFVRTDGDVGLTKDDADRLIAILK